jgi:hypothetical protein
MPKSENGWEVIDSQSSPKLVVIRIPGTGTPGIPLRLRKEAAPILAYVASRVHAEVSDLKQGNKPGVQDEGGYNYRGIEGSTKLSNHASGTAIDLNWNKYPMFKRKMNKKERAAAEAIASELSEVIRWGGNYRPTQVDEMHWEISPRVTAAQLAKFCKERGIDKFGKVK